MACCLTAPSHYLNQCWLMISEVLWHSHDKNFTEKLKMFFFEMSLNSLIWDSSQIPQGPGPWEIWMKLYTVIFNFILEHLAPVMLSTEPSYFQIIQQFKTQLFIHSLFGDDFQQWCSACAEKLPLTSNLFKTIWYLQQVIVVKHEVAMRQALINKWTNWKQYIKINYNLCIYMICL